MTAHQYQSSETSENHKLDSLIFGITTQDEF